MSSKTFPTLQTETRLFQSSVRFVIGVDEVGRGAIAGPVAVGLAMIDRDSPQLEKWPEALQDSKLMTQKNREEIFPELSRWAYGHSVGYATNSEIDEMGINSALALAFSRGLTELTASAELRGEMSRSQSVILLDGSQNWLGAKAAGLDVALQVRADADCVSVAAASVIAKVQRDLLMRQLATEYPEYGLDGHKGYASNAHISALRVHGPSAIHRISWLSRILS
jgi:ribonuclease HII